MSKYGFLVGLATILGGALTSSASVAEAQARQAVSMTGAPALTAPAPAPQEDEEETRDRRDPMEGAVSIGLKIGAAGTGVASYTFSSKGESYRHPIDARRGLHIALPIHFGGSGFSWTLEPFLSKSSIARDVKDSDGSVLSTEELNLMAYGLYTGPVYNIHIINPLYIGIGAGLKGAYVKNEAFKTAADLYARVPLSATYYLTHQVALVAELGLGYGFSAFLEKPEPVFDAVENDVRLASDDPQFGKAFAWDCSFGVRLP